MLVLVSVGVLIGLVSDVCGHCGLYVDCGWTVGGLWADWVDSVQEQASRKRLGSRAASGQARRKEAVGAHLGGKSTPKSRGDVRRVCVGR